MVLDLPLIISLSAAETTALGAVTAATVAAVVSIGLNYLGRKREDRNRRRDLYSEAYRVALEWCEAIYRVRRRARDGSQDRELVARFHDLQERVAYYQGWLQIEDETLGKAYQEFLDKVVTACKPLLQQAWGQFGREPTSPTPNEPAPVLDQAKREFIAAVRKHINKRRLL